MAVHGGGFQSGAEGGSARPAGPTDERTASACPAQTSGAGDSDTFRAKAKRRLDSALHRPAERDPALELVGDALGDELGVDFRLADLDDVQRDVARGHRRQPRQDARDRGEGAWGPEGEDRAVSDARSSRRSQPPPGHPEQTPRPASAAGRGPLTARTSGRASARRTPQVLAALGQQVPSSCRRTRSWGRPCAPSRPRNISSRPINGAANGT